METNPAVDNPCPYLTPVSALRPQGGNTRHNLRPCRRVPRGQTLDRMLQLISRNTLMKEDWQIGCDL
jgi:hypothetical protein